MPVLISARTRRASRSLLKRLNELAEAMLSELDCADSELSILLCDDREIRTLNERYRNQPKATDVLAFGNDTKRSKRAASRSGPVRDPVLGDVVISVQTAEQQAHSNDASLVQETAFLMAHGLLHLLGMDHDTPRKAAQMNRRTAALLQSVGLTAPSGAEALAPPVSKAAKRPKHRPKVRPRVRSVSGQRKPR